MPYLWSWVGRHKVSGAVERYQCESPSGDRDAMLAHLQRHYRNLDITELQPASIYKPSIGRMDYHTFDHGIIDAAIQEIAQARMKSRVIFGGTSLLSGGNPDVFDPFDELRKLHHKPAPAVPGKSLLRKGA